MELPSKLLEQISFNTRSRIKKHILIVMDKSTHEEHLCQHLQTNKKQFKIAVTFLTGCNGVLNITNKHNKFYFAKSITDEDGFIQTTIPQGAYEIEFLNIEFKRIIFDKGHFTEVDYTFTITPNFPTLGSIIEISSQGPIVSFLPDDSIRDILGFNATTLYEEYNLSPNPVDILSFDNLFLETNITQGMVFKGKRFGIIHNWTMTVDPG